MYSYTAAVAYPSMATCPSHNIVVFKGGGVYFQNKEVLLLANLTFTFVTNVNVKLSSNKTSLFFIQFCMMIQTCEVV